MNILSHTNNQMSPTDWAELYKEYHTEASCPDMAFRQITPQRAVFRGLVQNLSDIGKQIEQSGCIPHTVVIYTDILIVPDSEFTLQSAVLTVYARRVEVTSAASLLFSNQTTQASLIIFSDEWTGQLKVKTAGESLNEITLVAPAPGMMPGLHLRLSSGVFTTTRIDYKQGIGFEDDEHIGLYLSNLFILASLLYSDHPSIALSLLLWIKQWSTHLRGMEMQFYRCLSLSNQLQAEIDASLRGSRFIPYLSKTVYEKLADAFVNEIKSYENNYMHLFTLSTLTQENIEMVRTMVSISKSEQNYIKSLLGQATDNYNNAQEAVVAARTNFKNQEKIVRFLAIDFEEKGIPRYQREQILKAVISLLTAVVQFGAGIASLAAGNPGGGGAAADGAINTAESVAKAAGTAKDVAETAKKTGDTMKKLKELIKVLKEIYEFSNKVASFVKDIQKAKNATETINKMESLTNSATLNIIDAWDAYILQVDNMIADPVSKGIEYAAEYKESLDLLAIYGKSMCKAELAAIKTSQEMMAIVFKQTYAIEKEAELKKLVANLQTGQEMPLKLMQLLCQKYLDCKSSLFCALKSYQSSYFYWSFRESDIQPRIASHINVLASDLHEMTQMAMDTQHALELFYPQPQVLKNGNYEITDPAVITNLKKEGKATFCLPIDAEELKGLERVRIDTVQVWLEGVRFDKKSKTVLIHLENAGNYTDRYKGKEYQFTSRPLKRSFQYEVTAEKKGSAHSFADGTYGLVKLDGKVDAEVAYAYFRPTPFSEWTISIASKNNPGLDLSGVSKIVFCFDGTAIPAG